MRWIVHAVAVRDTPNGQLVRQLATFELPESLDLFTHYSALRAAQSTLVLFPREGEEVSFHVIAAPIAVEV